MNLDEIIEKIKANHLFLKLKNIVENNAYHDHQKTFDHLILTCEKAKEASKGNFITNKEARLKFLEFMNEKVYGMKRSDVLIIVALLHDIGKILWFKEGAKEKPLEMILGKDITAYPSHEYWGSTIIKDVLEGMDLNNGLVSYISKCVGIHGEFSDPYLKPRLDWPFEKLINDVKSKCEGLYKESLFNQYCDCFYGKPFQYGIELIAKIFSNPELYTPRKYFIAKQETSFEGSLNENTSF